MYKAWRAVAEAAPAKARRCWWYGRQGDDGGARPAPGGGGSRNAQGRAERSRSCSAAKTPIVVRPPLLLPRAPARAAARAAGRHSMAERWRPVGGDGGGLAWGGSMCIDRPQWMTDAASAMCVSEELALCRNKIPNPKSQAIDSIDAC